LVVFRYALPDPFSPKCCPSARWGRTLGEWPAKRANRRPLLGLLRPMFPLLLVHLAAGHLDLGHVDRVAGLRTSQVDGMAGVNRKAGKILVVEVVNLAIAIHKDVLRAAFDAGRGALPVAHLLAVVLRGAVTGAT